MSLGAESDMFGSSLDDVAKAGVNTVAVRKGG